MTKKMETVIAVIAEGGRFRTTLEPNFRGHMKFRTRLYTAEGKVVPGIGPAAERAWKLVETAMEDKYREILAKRT